SGGFSIFSPSQPMFTERVKIKATSQLAKSGILRGFACHIGIAYNFLTSCMGLALCPWKPTALNYGVFLTAVRCRYGNQSDAKLSF
ncbi:hypothetical protein SCB29_37330, partial [Paraburkholderia sp. SIMBA_055]